MKGDGLSIGAILSLLFIVTFFLSGCNFEYEDGVLADEWHFREH